MPIAALGAAMARIISAKNQLKLTPNFRTGYVQRDF